MVGRASVTQSNHQHSRNEAANFDAIWFQHQHCPRLWKKYSQTRLNNKEPSRWPQLRTSAPVKKMTDMWKFMDAEWEDTEARRRGEVRKTSGFLYAERCSNTRKAENESATRTKKPATIVAHADGEKFECTKERKPAITLIAKDDVGPAKYITDSYHSSTSSRRIQASIKTGTNRDFFFGLFITWRNRKKDNSEIQTQRSRRILSIAKVETKIIQEWIQIFKKNENLDVPERPWRPMPNSPNSTIWNSRRKRIIGFISKGVFLPLETGNSSVVPSRRPNSSERKETVGENEIRLLLYSFNLWKINIIRIYIYN